MSTTPKSKQQLISGIEKNILNLNEKIIDNFKEIKAYCEFTEEEDFAEKPNEKEEDIIKRAESKYYKINEYIKRNEISNKKVIETIELLVKITKIYECIVGVTNQEKDELLIKNNEIIDKIIDLENRKTSKQIIQNPKRKNMNRGIFEDKKQEWNKKRILFEIKNELTTKQQKQPISNLDNNEIKQIETWTSMKVGNVIFDSDVHDWNNGTSELGGKVINKSHLIFLIEDTIGNKFGGYLNMKIERYGLMCDPKTFLFSLKSNGRLNGMLKFEGIKDPRNLFALDFQSSSRLFTFGDGYDIFIAKENKKNESYCIPKPYCFKYNGIESALCGKSIPSFFTPKRITVIQLI